MSDTATVKKPSSTTADDTLKEKTRDPNARESLARTGRSAVINIWVDPREYAPGTKNQTMYK